MAKTKKRTGGRRGEMRRQPDGGNRSRTVANTPRQSEISDRRRKAAGGGAGPGQKVKVKQHTRKGKTVKAYERGQKKGAAGGAGQSKVKTAQAGKAIKGQALKGFKKPKGIKKGMGVKSVGQGTQARGAIRTRAAAEGAKYAKKATAKPGKTKDHTKAGLHRVGKKGNEYVDKTGKIFRRGKGGSFKEGASKRGKAILKKAHGAQRSHDTAQKFNQQDDATRLKKMKSGKTKVPKGYMMHEDASIGKKLKGSKTTNNKGQILKVKTQKTGRGAKAKVRKAKGRR